jgi:hypothetical protein
MLSMLFRVVMQDTGIEVAARWVLTPCSESSNLVKVLEG